MTKLVVFKLDGDFVRGFKVDVEIFRRDRSIYSRKSATLPPQPELLECLESWQQEYRELGDRQRIKGNKVVITNGVTKTQLHFWSKQLRAKFKNWLRADTFQDVNLWLRENLNPQETIRVLLCSNRQQVHQLPWNEWDLVKRYLKVEIALSGLDITALPNLAAKAPKSQVKILAIFGSSKDIDIERDLSILKSLENTYLEPLIEPQLNELHDRLWSGRWDIVFFAGHSETIEEEGIIYLNEQTTLTIGDLEYAFQKAIANGLQLAIFNSCDGLGLAYALEKLGLPQAIVMREPIIDCVAHQFLNYFLRESSRGQPLHLAIRQARERLQGWEKQYPCSSWLPVLYQNQSATPFVWFQPLDRETLVATKKLERLHYRNLILVSTIAFLLVWCFQTLGWLQSGELFNYDRALSLRPPEIRDERILVITIGDRDIKYQAQQGATMRGSLADSTLLQLLAKLQLYQPVAIASDVIHDFAYTPELSQAIDRQHNFVAICRVANTESKIESIEPPFGTLPEQTGFTNMAIDRDGVIRRQILGMSPDKVCQTDISLSLRMALKYLDYVAAKENNRTRYPREFIESDRLKIGRTVLPKMEFDSGAYQLPKSENRGYQILLNYRANYPQTISLRAILEETSDEKLARLIKEKIVFIGVKVHNSDLYFTPYSKGQQLAKVSGVLIHAQATSQLISSVLDRRILLKWFDSKTESLWIFSWAFIGSQLILIGNNSLFDKHDLSLIIFVAIISFLGLLYLSYLGLLVAGYWLSLIAPTLAFFLGAIGSLWLFGTKKLF